jgi:3',5'-cyclic-AMP phosphodiesterase
MLIAQITDIHLGFEPGNPDEFNRQRLDALLAHINNGPNRPDLLLATGDLVDLGDVESYQRLQEALSVVSCPVLMGLGNHDLRDNFHQQFPETPVAGGFIQYVKDYDGLRVIMLDTLDEGRHGGAFCETRAAWLKARLAEEKTVPTVLVMHHPPVEVGIDWMNTHPNEPWVARFAGAIEGADQIKGIICGHLHRNIVVPWHGTAIAICASTAPQVTLDLRPIDPDLPDDRPMIVADPPSYALHFWNGRELVTHFANANEPATLARYNVGMQPLVQSLLAERNVVEST